MSMKLNLDCNAANLTWGIGIRQSGLAIARNFGWPETYSLKARFGAREVREMTLRNECKNVLGRSAEALRRRGRIGAAPAFLARNQGKFGAAQH